MQQSSPHADSDSFEARLGALVERANVKARLTGSAVLVSVTEPAGDVDPLEALETLCLDPASDDAEGAQGRSRMYWNREADGFELAGFCAVATFAPTGVDRFAAVESAWNDLLDGALVDDPSRGLPGVGPTLMGGFAFDRQRPATKRWNAFPEALLFLPRLQLTITGNERWLTTNALIRPDGSLDINAAVLGRFKRQLQGDFSQRREMATRSHEWRPIETAGVHSANEWRAMVSEAVKEIGDGAFEKVVLAREVRAIAPHDLNVGETLRHLRSAHPDCYVFGFWRGGSAFVGASPERLVRLDGHDVQASSLAGSVRRGTSPGEDAALAAGLLSSAKDRKEHEFVRTALCSGMAELCDDITADDEPSILSLKQVHHLHTAVRARLRTGHSLLELVARIHPTPAVGGEPREAALRFIREHEKMDRGWYAAPIGWLQRDRGEFAVALRSALITGSEASLFGGCGIVAGSIPDDEYAESELKLRPMELALAAAS